MAESFGLFQAGFWFSPESTRARKMHKGGTKGKTDIWQQVRQRIPMPRMAICTQTVAWNLVLSLYFIPLAPIFYTSMHRRSRLEGPKCLAFYPTHYHFPCTFPYGPYLTTFSMLVPPYPPEHSEVVFKLTKFITSTYASRGGPSL